MIVKSGVTAFLLWCCGFVGLCGLHRFYLGRPWTGLLWLCTLGLLGIGQLIDLFMLGSMVRQANLLNGLARASANVSNHNVVAPVIHVNVDPTKLSS
ncbi:MULTISPECIES: TM2 domain-containing protein [Brucella/Ochrobactrum group]|uniref:TM2 domain-containing protein n=1 Tax=Brucella/Ochrobactrum group TaxID=2826938 RepID=UPI001F406178|nr:MULTISPECIES: TM2 domain-containing protein [Brucella]WHS32053.1 TM2 domain-containing protein [Brucella sp. NM4]WHT41466.1 TM2 domain-containing protein [Ochrobactrum sp. SSR]